MTEYSEGPWEIVEQNENSMFVPFAKNPYCIVASGRLIAIGQQQAKRTMANARLIKSAPKLLEALKRLLEDCEDRGPLPSSMNMAREAIAEARGD